MNVFLLMAFQDEMSKIAGLNVKQLEHISNKALKRGWSGARESQHIKKVLDWQDKAARGVKRTILEKTYVPPGGKATVVGRRPRPPVAEASSQKKPGNLSRGLAMGAGGIGFGLGAGAVHHQRHDQQGYAFPAV